MMNWSDAEHELGPVTVTVTSHEALFSDIEDRMQARRGFSIATLNLDHVIKLRRLPHFLKAYRTHTHVTADGNPIVWLSRLSGQKMDLVPGSELIDPLCDMAANLGVRVAFLGSTEASLDAAADVLEKRYPGLLVVTKIAPPMGFEPTGELADRYIKELAEAEVNLCFLALGAPKQELFAAYAQNQLDQTGFLSIGAGLDFISGLQKRAPKFARMMAAEWFWRLASSPVRMGPRYAACIAALPGLVLRAMRIRWSDRKPAPS